LLLTFFLILPPSRSTLFPYTTLFRSCTRLFFDHFARFLFIGQLHNQGNVSCRIVEKNPVRVLTMLPQSFPVISDDDDQRSLIPVLLLQVVEEATQSRIREGNLSIVEVILVPLRIRRRGLVGIMRII